MINPSPPPDYFAVKASGDVAGLTATFELITGKLITSCRLTLKSVPVDTGLLNVYIDDKLIPQSGPDGWDLDQSTTPPTVVLKGATCTAMETKGAKVVSINYGCPTLR